ncbi:MAG: energy transducer TonB [Acidobacteriia bacterium]|nr:energy transducer TonB [Terriglobia bacterium]
MKKLPSTLALATLILNCALSTLALTSFKSAEVTSAGDVQFPAGSIASGIVVVDVQLNSKGDVTGTEVQRDIASLTSVATSSVKSWKYLPASMDGSPQNSLLRVAFAFRPRVIMAAPPIFDPLHQPDDETPDVHAGYAPAGIIGVAYPAYPIDAATVGAVVVQVGVDADGKVGKVKLVRSYNPFDQFSLEATKKWQFSAATFHGEPVASSMVIAFVYSSPTIAN